jgi:serine/threonine-protein kinase
MTHNEPIEAAIASDPMRPARLGPYAIVRPLGHGGMASVYEAVHVGLGKRVAIKVMQPHLAAHETTSARFVREGRAVAKVRHAHVVDVFDVGAHEGVPYLVMELLEGTDLADYLKCHTRLGLAEAVDIMLPVCSAVAAAHEAGIVHRDLKPANIFLSRGVRGGVHPKVLDFGISTFMEKEGDLDLTHTQTMLGTVRYMSPEQTRGAKFADARSDQYSLGVMLYLCTTGQVPFSGEGVYETIHAIRNAPLLPPGVVNPALPRELDAVVARALSRDPNGRFPSVVELGRALLPFATRRSSAGWEREFVAYDEEMATTRPDAPSAAAVAAAADSTAAATVGSPRHVPGEDATAMTSVTQATRARSKRTRTIVVVGAGFALAAALGAIFVVPRLGSTGAAQVGVKAAATAAAPVAPAASSAPSEAKDDVSSADQGSAAPAAPPPTASSVPASATRGQPKPAHAVAPAGASRPRPAPAATGNNGAPILE